MCLCLISAGFNTPPLAAGYFIAQQKALEAKVKAEQALLGTTAMRLVAEGGTMTSVLRPGGTIQGLFKVLAGHQIVRSANTDEALQIEYLKLNHLIFVKENLAEISSAAFNLDGKRIVSVDWDHALRLWEVFEV